ncbi:trypsin, alkaline A-like [Manduca sexta]|uniref:Peptidase S1 domain-containing protein n=1 Tax=Manduca sexta TaxID=7130 RepID=A0A921ZIV0_MANSE|nr:trypsin, alkaline A-like [Manduca sexta]KAG6458287.1 hypothetical protein O3G_MSEX010786 [Manduca sexta]KAG6458288.1 hypothetical protein O3G_MSEX010786 [Manduca sexta]
MLFIVLIGLFSCALAEPTETRVVGGSSVAIEEYPFIAVVQRVFDEVWWEQTCAGTLITQVVVLSAAHCFESEPPHLWRIRLGSRMASSGGSLHTVQRIVLHPDFHYLYNDVALVRLSVPAVISSTVNRARIAGVNYNLADGTVVRVAGWGANMFRVSSEILLSAEIRIFNQQLCAERWAHLKTQPGQERWPDITDGMICAGIDGVGHCSGDSGGPVVHQNDIVIGIVSFTYICGHHKYPGVHARVSYYSDWIANTANSL